MAVSVWRVRVIGKDDGTDRYLSTYHFDADGAADASDVASAVDTYLNALKAQVVTGVQMRRDPVMQKVDVGSGDVVAEASANAVEYAGTKTQLQEWTVKQGLIAWRSPVFIDGRRLVGRTFVYGVPGDAGEQEPGSGYISVLQSAANGLIADSQSQGCPLQCVRRPRLLEGGGALAPGSSEDATSAAVRTYWAVLKSRR